MELRELLLPEWDQEMASTRKILDRVPDGKLDYKPHEKSMTMGRLAGHVAELAQWAETTIASDALDIKPGQQPFVPTSKAEIIESFDNWVVGARAAIANATDQDLAKTWTLTFAGKQIMSMPKHAVLRSMVFNHMVHHRAQLGVYLRLNEIEVPGVYGPSADEIKYWTAT